MKKAGGACLEEFLLVASNLVKGSLSPLYSTTQELVLRSL